MNKYNFIFLILFFLLSCSTEREIVVVEDGFKNIRIGQTRISAIKRAHPFAKRSKTWRHALLRTGEGRVGVMFNYEQVKLKNGITYLFYYESGQERPITLDEILFEHPIKAITHDGIRLGESTFQDVVEKYGEADYTVEGKICKGYDKIEFYSAQMAGTDSIDQNYVVTAFKIKR